MIISLIGYMGSGKSHISKVLSQKTNLKLIDLDKEIFFKNNMTIPEIFEKKGEIYFRKQERLILEELFDTEKDCILSLGGGTPAYYNNIELITQKSESVYLRSSVKTLTERLLKQKQKRPLIAKIPDGDLPEFIAKHLFERQVFYGQAKYTVVTDSKTPDEITDEIIALI
ncbi:shikimate kinase [Kaistella flava (ex Peng et al. 2021)]|uniref:Shikimate kinase n=1 Tax=Kaistella flava (ex Peng et al. 2021) TaxID=2038776 RepID=A0A7M2YEH5_9FLAO|nr:shikimate kinase [Kaistella flava (ex Peng et al. 2021)]QOW11803.1 shikimate kinase [Kaistella flava (ex Peng et al. 2021)]